MMSRVTMLSRAVKGSSVVVLRDGVAISPWHDLPLVGEHGLRFVNEIPPGVFQPKMEIDSKGDGRTIIQDTKKGQLRFYKHPVATRWNYGALPQTYEDPHAVWPGTELKGDGDPLDAVEIGAGALEIGEVVEVRVLGALGLIDEGEIDWKLVTVRVGDAVYGNVDDVEDLWGVDPQLLRDIRNWFRDYKLAEGKSVNEFLFDGSYLNGAYARGGVLAEAHRHWLRLGHSKQ